MLKKQNWSNALLMIAAVSLPTLATVMPAHAVDIKYGYQNVLIGCEGQVTGMQSHPRDGNLVYLRGDGGSFRSDSGTGKWICISDKMPPVTNVVTDNGTPGGGSVPEALGLDPSNLDIVYAGIGGGIIRSTDRGDSWSAIQPILNSEGQPIHQNWNNEEEGKFQNHRIAVDPNNCNIVYYGTTRDGLFKSTDGGVKWAKIKTFSTDAAPGDVVAFDKGGGITQLGGQSVSSTIYVGVGGGNNAGVWRSRDGGASWKHLGGQAMSVTQAMVAPNGTLYIAGSSLVGAVKRGSDVIKNITPIPASSYNAIAVDATDPQGQSVLVCDNIYSNNSGPQHVWWTTDGGTTWKNRVGKGINPVPWSDEIGAPSRRMQACCFNATTPGIVWIGDSFGPWKTLRLQSPTPIWTCAYEGYEAMTAMWPFCPPSGAPLLTGCMDPSAYRSASVTAFPTEVLPVGGRVNTIAWCETDPNYVALASDGSYYGYTGNSGYSTSTDNMATTKNVTDPRYGGVVAVAARKQGNGKPVLLHLPATGGVPRRSLDWGATWLPVSGAPSDLTIPFWQNEQFVAADKVHGSKFYIYDIRNGDFYRSTDGAASFSKVSQLSAYNKRGLSLTAQPGVEGKLWINNCGRLRYSRDSGVTWQQVSNIKDPTHFTMGKAAPGRTNPALYVFGTVNGEWGIWRSDDATSLTGDLATAGWVRIWNPNSDYKLPNRANALGGDMQTYGRIYFAVGGRGVIYGNPVK